MNILLVNPPFYGASGPYPATCYLKGFLKTIRISASQYDANIGVLLKIFSSAGLVELRNDVTEKVSREGWTPPEPVQTFIDRFQSYWRSIDTAILVLQGRDQGAIARALRPGFFPPPLDKGQAWAHSAYTSVQTLKEILGPLTPGQTQRVSEAGSLQFVFGKLGETDKSRFLASRFLADVLLVIQHVAEEDFQFDEYLKELTWSAYTFAPLDERLKGRPNLIDRAIDDLTADMCSSRQPDLVGLSVPFGGNVYGALRMAQAIKRLRPETTTVMGGGFVNTVLRSLTDPGIFDYIDYITLDDGEAPLQCLLEMLQGTRARQDLCRTFFREQGQVVYVSSAAVHDIPSSRTGLPTYDDLPLNSYLSYWPTLTTHQAIWARRWNKLTLAHGCYWRKCAFCDTTLDYVGRYDPSSLDVIIERIRHLVDETGESGFHFVDEALPPALLRKLAERLIDENLQISWWGNARFDKTFEAMAPILAQSGCIAITGGLETASNRLLKLMSKGVSLEQVARVTNALSRQGIFVHAYLIYGFPTQTAQETIDALEFVRQLFAENCIQSAVWARFFLTEFSPIATAPERFGVRITQTVKHPFCNANLEYEEQGGANHDLFTEGLQKALASYLRGFGWDRPVQDWFGPEMKLRTTLSSRFVKDSLGTLADPPARPTVVPGTRYSAAPITNSRS